jgi:Putative papain-like cysteine peptidase (DUF1796)
MSVHYLTIGHDCSPAAALRGLDLREFALPFDWVVSNVNTLEVCFRTNFNFFHKNLVFNHNKTRLIDFYGFQFPHDYPLNDMSNHEDDIGEGLFAEEKGKSIINDWTKYHNMVLDKYDRRIQRFNHIINDAKPIIVLCRYNTLDVFKLQNIFMKYYNNHNLYFVNSARDPFENDNIINIHTEKNNIWNELEIWKKALK